MINTLPLKKIQYVLSIWKWEDIYFIYSVFWFYCVCPFLINCHWILLQNIVWLYKCQTEQQLNNSNLHVKKATHHKSELLCNECV